MHAALFVVLFVVFALVVGLGVWLRALADFLIVPERLPAHADAIVVLGGGDRHGSREGQAARLYAQGIAPLVLTTGGPVAGEPAPATYAEWSVERLMRRGIPRDAVVPTNEGDSTVTDARGVRELAEARGWHDIVLVTDNWHSRRTELAFEYVFRGTPVRLFSSPAPSPRFYPDSWWTDEDSAQFVTTEYIKLAAFALGVGD